MKPLLAYMPIDRSLALARGESLPEHTAGTALFADISGFTLLTEALARELGPQRGAEEVTRHLNLVYDAVIAELYRYRGTVLSFSGDAITCWFDGDSGLRATASALAMQQAMQQFHQVVIPSGRSVSLAMKAAVVSGTARRFIVGDPLHQLIDVLVGNVLDDLAAAEQLAAKGEVLLDAATAAALGDHVQVSAWREDAAQRRFAVVGGLAHPVPAAPWPELPADALTPDQIRPWLLPAVYERLTSGLGNFLAELRPAVSLFLHFAGVDNADSDAPAKLDEFVRHVQHIVGRYEGVLLQITFGDKGSYLNVGFGALLAHEDDAVRAASAALELRDMALASDHIRDVRIGISQGRMRVGAYGGAMRRTYGLLGDDVNLAARLMTAASPGAILISRSVHQALGGAFIVERLPDLSVKGKSEPVSTFSLLSANERRAASLADDLAALPLVGRQTELELAQERLARVLAGQGQVIGITAEAGLGKSRLVAEIVRLADAQGMAAYAGECLSYGTNTSYLVWHDIWRGLFGLEHGRESARQVAALSEQLRQIHPRLVSRLPLLGPLLNLSIPDNDLTRSFDAKLRKTSLEALLLDSLRHRAQRGPLCLVLEDCQWLDPLSRELLEVLARSIVELSVLIVLTYREQAATQNQVLPVSQLPHFVEIGLNELMPEQAHELLAYKVRQLFGPQVVPQQALVERIASRASGNPFYIEELLNYLHDLGVSPQDSQAFERLDLPASLHSLVLARIDQLAERQSITLRVASIVGRQFGETVLCSAFPQLGESEHVHSDLEGLSRLELTVRDAAAKDPGYLFRQIVTHEVAYQSLPHAMRSILHEQAGCYLEDQYGAEVDQFVDILAYHFDHSENQAKQREYLLKAGESAQANYANAAALDYFRRVLPLLPPEDKAPVMLKLGQVLELVGEWSDAGAMYAQALAQAEQLGNRPHQARCQTAMAELLRKQGDYAAAAGWLDRAQAVFRALGDQAGVGQVLHYAGSLSAQQGDYARAQDLYQQSLLIRQAMGDQANVANLLSNLGIVARFQGDYVRARELHEQGLAIRRGLGDRRAIAVSLNNLGNVALDQGSAGEARAHLEEAVAIQREVGDRAYIANFLDNLGNVVTALGEYTTARRLYDESLSINYQLGDRWTLAYVLEDIGCLAARQGQAAPGLQLIAAAGQLRQQIGAPLSPAEHSKLEARLAEAGVGLLPAAQHGQNGDSTVMSLEQAIAFAQAEVLGPSGSASG